VKRVLLACAAFALVAASPAEETRHTVKDGETLNGIANRAGVPASAIIKANGLKPPYPVRVGQVLEIPRSENAKPKPKPASTATSPAPAAGSATHVVKDGETLNGIANRAGVSATALADANKLKPPYALRTGQKLIVPGKSGQKPAKPAPSSAPAPASSGPATDDGEVYVVKDGETFNGIANRTGIPRSVLAQANGLTAPYVVKSGQKLVIPRQKVHVVANGETGFGISFKYGVPYEDILTANGLPKDSVLKPGQKLVIPALVDSKLPATAPAASAPAPAASPRCSIPPTGLSPSRVRSSSSASGSPRHRADCSPRPGSPHAPGHRSPGFRGAPAIAAQSRPGCCPTCCPVEIR